jgi:zinc protease
VQQFFDTYYAPNNAVLAIAGDIDPAQAEALVRKYFGTIPRRPAPPPVDVSEPAGVVSPKNVADDPHADTPAVAIAWKTPDRRAPDFYAIALLKAILFDGDSSRLYQSLVKKEAAALDIRGTLEERRGPGQLIVFVVHKAEVKSEEVRAIIEAEVARVKRDGVTAGELAKAKNQYRLSRFTCESTLECTGLQTALGRALELAEFSLFDGDPALVNSELNRYFAVSPEQVRDAARRLFTESNEAALFIRPAKQP